MSEALVGLRLPPLYEVFPNFSPSFEIKLRLLVQWVQYRWRRVCHCINWGTVLVGTGLSLYNTGVQYWWGRTCHCIRLGYSTGGDRSVTV
ncbi:hypothetical protein scyTo_0019219 [Scyliorhinus torazame]|uniref:Uncharacterized protein n=1 Tax=Scyliorhinus torazame TaxID=75743 RepID=A0A401PV37_SCYTO|nr:hypothetical protein [Scyliorhinus torazame]